MNKKLQLTATTSSDGVVRKIEVGELGIIFKCLPVGTGSAYFHAFHGRVYTSQEMTMISNYCEDFDSVFRAVTLFMDDDDSCLLGEISTNTILRYE